MTFPGVTWNLPHASYRAEVCALVRSHSQPPSHVQLKSVMHSLARELIRYDIHRHGLESISPGFAAYRCELQSYYDDCQSIFAPIRRLPNEILAEIFSLFCDPFSPERPAPPLLTDMELLAHSWLLAVSQVCSRWHSIIMDTPTLWSACELTGALMWSTPRLETTMKVLKSVLERGRNCPISVIITDDDFLPLHGQVFGLLARHSHRWQSALFFCSLDGLDLSVLHGKLLHLKALNLNIPEVSSPCALDAFASAPNLDDLYINSELLRSTGPILPVKQLRRFKCDMVAYLEISSALALLSRLPNVSYFHLSFHTMDIKSSLLPALQIPPITSTISRLILAMEQRVDLDHSAQALGEIFASLTLPYLQEFELQGFCLTWPHRNFLALCERSSFRRCLKTLGVSHIVITEKELLQVLSALGSLEYLHIADQPLRSKGHHRQLSPRSDSVVCFRSRASSPSAAAPLFLHQSVMLHRRHLQGLYHFPARRMFTAPISNHDKVVLARTDTRCQDSCKCHKRLTGTFGSQSTAHIQYD
ncbi:hypothetical protein GGX14DRAFT_604528 [Mycena pura]|uniref:F-box domain-containing protein n=1 Tax=Mycena pura TaxID=153505 RepID=A0AAD6VLC6_9AGAR|nr:hypothetical protein GGX14DRAFT_604528 [Mycena pura]